MKKILMWGGAIAVLASSCVPGRQYQELEVTKNQIEADNQQMRADLEKLRSDQKDLESENFLNEESIEKLRADTLYKGETNRELRGRYDKLNELNDMLMNKNNKLMQESVAENRKLLEDLERANRDLQGKEDRLSTLEGTLNEKEENLAAVQKDLADREKRVNELESTLSAQGDAMNALKNKVANALLGFKDKGLKVEQKDGKVYVSLEAKLLFPSGSTKINSEGKKALIDLAKAVEGQEDLDVIVEGHTDSDKLSSASHPKNNWELSVLRATAVVDIMLGNSTLDATTLSAAGRGEFQPLDPANKAKNRRIEIILTPNLDELFDIIQQ